jgi:hypothetical protein
MQSPDVTSAAEAAPEAETPLPGALDNASPTPDGGDAPLAQTFSSPGDPTAPATKQAAPPDASRMLAVPPPQGGGGEGMGGGGAGGPGDMGSETSPAPGGELGSFGDPVPPIVPLPDETPAPVEALTTTGESTPEAVASPTPPPSPTDASQVSLAPGASDGSTEATPTFLPEVDGDAVSDLRAWRDRWAQPIRVAEIALGALAVVLLAATWVAGRRS